MANMHGETDNTSIAGSWCKLESSLVEWIKALIMFISFDRASAFLWISVKELI